MLYGNSNAKLQSILSREITYYISNPAQHRGVGDYFVKKTSTVAEAIADGLDYLTMEDSLDNGGPNLTQLKKAITLIKENKFVPNEKGHRITLYQGINGVSTMVGRVEDNIAPVSPEMQKDMEEFPGMTQYHAERVHACAANKPVLERLRKDFLKLSESFGLARNIDQVSATLAAFYEENSKRIHTEVEEELRARGSVAARG